MSQRNKKRIHLDYDCSKDVIKKESSDSSDPASPNLQSLFSPLSARQSRSLSSLPTAATQKPVIPNNEICLASAFSAFKRKVKHLKTNQNHIWCAILELQNSIKEISGKIDSLNRIVQEHAKTTSAADNEDMDVVTLLPVDEDSLSQLEENLAGNPSLRRGIAKMLMKTVGKDSKGLTANLLRKLISDNLAEKFSLTGRQMKFGSAKQSFEKTEIYKLVTEIVFRIFSNAQENIIREAISDWLMQAKFRKIRREKRLHAVQDEPDVKFYL